LSECPFSALKNQLQEESTGLRRDMSPT
jgi:hypothetical protein